MYTRREFLYKSFLASSGLTVCASLPQKLFSSENYFKQYVGKDLVKFSLLHTNDMHSRIEPFSGNDPKYPGMGGMARRARLIEKIRMEEKNVLLLDAGDVFQGTPYFNLFGGELEFKLMSKMKYDACTLGNHDFDNGLEGFSKMLPHAEFPFICSNYDFSDTILNGLTLPNKIFTLDGIKVGVFGLGIELDGLVEKKLYGKTIYNDPVAIARQMASTLKNDMKCHLVICISHLGYKYESEKMDDIKLAGATEHIDIIIGGHTHTFLDQPVIVKNLMNREVLINQVGWAGLRLGKIDCYFERGSWRKKITKTNFFAIK